MIKYSSSLCVCFISLSISHTLLSLSNTPPPPVLPLLIKTPSFSCRPICLEHRPRPPSLRLNPRGQCGRGMIKQCWSGFRVTGAYNLIYSFNPPPFPSPLRLLITVEYIQSHSQSVIFTQRRIDQKEEVEVRRSVDADDEWLWRSPRMCKVVCSVIKRRNVA